MSRRPSVAVRRVALAPLTLALVAGLGACSATNPITTAADYAASDGVRTEAGDLRLGNLLVVAAEKGGAGTLVGSVTNDGSSDARVILAVDGAEAGAELTVDAGQTLLLTPEGGETVELAGLPVGPGQYVDVQVVVDGAVGTTVAVPVLDTTLPEYASLLPKEKSDDEAEADGEDDATEG